MKFSHTAAMLIMGQQLYLDVWPSPNIAGVYAKDAAGNLAHFGASPDTHIVFEVGDDGPELTGHVDSVAVANSATLRLPK